MALREAMNEEDFGPIRIAPVLRRNGVAIWRLHRDRLEPLFLRLAGRCKRDEKRRDRNSGKVGPRGCVDHRRSSLITDARADRRSYEAVMQPRSDRSIVRPPACTFHVGGARTPYSRPSPSRSRSRSKSNLNRFPGFKLREPTTAVIVREC